MRVVRVIFAAYIYFIDRYVERAELARVRELEERARDDEEALPLISVHGGWRVGMMRDCSRVQCPGIIYIREYSYCYILLLLSRRRVRGVILVIYYSFVFFSSFFFYFS